MEAIEIIYDLITGSLVSGLCIVLLYFLRKKLLKQKILDIGTAVVLYGLCLIRITIPITFPWGIIVKCNLLRPLSDAMLSEVMEIGNKTVYGYHIAGSVYALIALCLLLKLIYEYMHTVSTIKKKNKLDSAMIQSCISRVKKEIKSAKEVSIYSISDIQSPFSVGVRNPSIILPSWWTESCSEAELYYVLKHEYIHIIRHDLFIKLLMNVAVCLMFWNPCVYLLRADFEHSLELECDRFVIKDMNNSEKAAYMETILNIFANRMCYSNKKGNLRVPALNLITNRSENIEERFRCISKTDASRSRMNMVLIAFCLAFTFVSYSFVLQTQYEPPEEDIITDSDVYELDFEKDILIIDKNGDQTIRFENGQEISGNLISVDNWIANEGKVIYR